MFHRWSTKPLITELKPYRPDSSKPASGILGAIQDKYFEKDSEAKKILKSVAILTVAGEEYAGETDLYAVVGKTLREIKRRTADLQTARINNPIYPEEDFLESMRRHPDRHIKLQRFLADVSLQWSALASQNAGLDVAAERMKSLFGESIASEVVENYSRRKDELYRSSQIRMNAAGALGLTTAQAGIKARPHQFFGDN